MTTFWKREPWATDPQVLLDALEDIYRRALAVGKITSPEEACRKKIMANRGYFPGIPKDDLLKAIEALEVVYIPESIPPGPGFLFPVRDVTGEVHRVHIRLADETTYGFRYLSVVEKSLFIGPPWIGNDDETLERIINTQSVIVVEGPFDILAVKTLAPEVPVLCPLSKRLGSMHLDYLRILGTKRIITLWDNDEAGRKASLSKTWEFRSMALPVPGVKDPSDSLLKFSTMCDLQDILRSIPPIPPEAAEDD